MQTPSDDAQDDSYPPHQFASTTPQDIDIDAQAAAFSTQLVAAKGNISYAPHFHHGYAWVRSDEITSNQLTEAQYAFVDPPGYDKAWSTLVRENVLIISAAPNTGKRTAAMNLLTELRYPRAEHQSTAPARVDGFRKLAKDWEDPRVSKLPLFPNQALLLDLRDSADQKPDKEFGDQLVDYADNLKDIHSFLIILATAEVWASCVESTRALLVDDLKYPMAKEVIEKRLQHPTSLCPGRAAWLDDDPFRNASSQDLLPRDAVALYQAIAAADDSSAGREDAIDQFHGWRQHLADWWKEESGERGPYERAMQIVTASVGQAAAADVLTLTDRFLQITGHIKDVHLPLAGPDLSERLRRAGVARTEGGLLKLEPTRPRFSGAVLDHVWQERTQVHEPYKRWIAQVAKEQVGKKYIEQIAASVTGMGIRHNSVEFLELIETWARENTGQEVLATRMLEDTCLDPVVGVKVRERLRTWTENKTTPDQLITIVIGVCRGQLGYQRTALALLRLKKILLRDNADKFTDRVEESIVAIAHHPDRHWVVLLEVTGWLTSDPAAGRAGFLALMKPSEHSLLVRFLEDCRDDADLRDQLSTAWHSVMYSNPGDSEVVTTIRRLLAFANTRPDLIDVTVDILGPAIQGELKVSISGSVLLNAIDEVAESSGNAHSKLFTTLFGTTFSGPEPVAEVAEVLEDDPERSPLEDVSIQGEAIDGYEVAAELPSTHDSPPPFAPWPETPAVSDESDPQPEIVLPVEPHHSPESSTAFTSYARPNTPTAATPDAEVPEKRWFGRPRR